MTIWYPVIPSTFLSSHGTFPHEREMLVGEVEEIIRSTGGAEGAVQCTVNDTCALAAYHDGCILPAIAVLAVVVAGGLLPAPFMAVMEIVKSLFSCSPVRVYSLVEPGANATSLPGIPQPLIVNEYEIW